MVARDLHVLKEMGLIDLYADGWVMTRSYIIRAFLPRVAPTPPTGDKAT